MAITQNDAQPRYKKFVAAPGWVMRSSTTSDVTTDPILYTGTGAPSDSDGYPNGSMYLRQDGGTTAVLYTKSAGAYTNIGAFTGTDFGSALQADVVSESTPAAGVTVDGVLLKDSTVKTDTIVEKTGATGVTLDGLRLMDATIKPVSGGTAWCDLSACATGEADTILGANLADGWTIRTAALTYVAIATTTATPGIAETWTHTGAASAHAITGTINHATNAHIALDVAAVQSTTARTGGTARAISAKCTSLAGDLNSVVYSDFYASAPTDGGGTVVHSAYTVAAGHDRALDLTACATGEAIVAVADNKAIGLEIKEGATSIMRVATSDSAELITWGYAHAYAAAALAITDPGTGAAIPVTRSGVCNMTSAGAGETRTVAIPSFVGQTLTLCHDTDGGAIAVTFASGINQAGNTIATFTEVDDTLHLIAVTKAGTRRWAVVSNDGAVLS